MDWTILAAAVSSFFAAISAIAAVANIVLTRRNWREQQLAQQLAQRPYFSLVTARYDEEAHYGLSITLRNMGGRQAENVITRAGAVVLPEGTPGSIYQKVDQANSVVAGGVLDIYLDRLEFNPAGHPIVVGLVVEFRDALLGDVSSQGFYFRSSPVMRGVPPLVPTSQADKVFIDRLFGSEQPI